MTNKHTTGLSLIELLVVLVILGIVATWGAGQYLSYTETARRTDAMTTLNRMLSQQESFFSNNGRYTTNVGNLGYTAHAGDTAKTLSAEEHYVITFDNCTGRSDISNCLRIEAEVDPNGVQAQDEYCKSLWINSRGQRGFTPQSGVTPPSDFSCWR